MVAISSYNDFQRAIRYKLCTTELKKMYNVCDDKNVNWWKTIKVLSGLNARDTTLELYMQTVISMEI